jgi:hypothetical protein
MAANIRSLGVREVSRNLILNVKYGIYRPPRSVSEIFIPFYHCSVKRDSPFEANYCSKTICIAVHYPRVSFCWCHNTEAVASAPMQDRIVLPEAMQAGQATEEE